MAWSMEKGKKGVFMGPGFFGGRMVQPHKVSVATGNLWTVSDTEGCLGFPVDLDNSKSFTRGRGVNPALAMMFPVQVLKPDSREM